MPEFYSDFTFSIVSRRCRHPNAVTALSEVQLRVLYVFFILAHDRRRVLHFNVTENPTAAWTAQQIVEAFPDDTVPRYLVRDRDRIYGDDFTTRVDGLGIRQVPTSARSPWQNCYAERMIGSIRRECLNHGEVAFSTRGTALSFSKDKISFSSSATLGTKPSIYPAL
jgi:hypothetical protein